MAADESERLRVLHDYGVLDTDIDPVFEDLTALASRICQTPISLISLVDADRQWFKSHRGLEVRQTPVSLSFCAHTIREPHNAMVVQDATRDPRFRTNALVTGDPNIRFYAGVQLRTADGHALGTMCVIDRKPRTLTEEQMEALQILARQAMSQLELRRAVNALRTSEHRFECVARAVSDVIWDWDLRTGKIWWSEGLETTFGYSRESMLQGLDSWSVQVHPEDRERVVDGLHRALASVETSWQNEYRFRRQGGAYAIVQDRGQILRDQHGNAYRMVGGMTDLTERKQIEAQYLRAQRMESIGALASGIAHDLNNVLTPILMAINILEARLADDASALTNLRILERSTIRGAELVRQVLSFARGDEGVRQMTNVAEVLEEATRLATETFPRSISIERQSSKDLWPIYGDATQLHQVVMNLLVNARDAMPQGGSLCATACNAHLRDAECAPFKKRGGPYVIVAVRDTGIGMSPEILDRIFDPFFTTRPHGVGTGLGLSTAHGIVASHGGFVRVTTALGQGSTFEVCLPAAPKSQALAMAADSAKPQQGRGELILLVDDETSIRTIAAQTLQTHGYRVLTAENGLDALNVFSLHGQDIEAAVIDLMMPVMDGIALAVELRKLRPHLPIVATSGVHATAVVDSVALEVLPKPYTTESLLRQLRAAIDKTAPSRGARVPPVQPTVKPT
jgi:PAS domain S-box-containing protein